MQSAFGTPKTLRLWLFNNGTALIYVDSVRIIPEHAGDTEWKITNSQFTTNMFILGQDQLPDSLWYDVTFTRDASQPPFSTAKLVAYDENGINPISTLTAIGGLSVAANANTELRLNVTPNPVQNVLFVSVDGIDNSNVAIELLDVLGNSIMSVQGRGESIPVDLHTLTAGVYFVRVQAGDKAVTTRIVKQ